ncbi:MAG: hypothetical protein KDJ88_11735 [Bauldia sp.]|nr:hypothetical protein [Bauldia sp.]
MISLAVAALGACSAQDSADLVTAAATPAPTAVAAQPTLAPSTYCPPIQIRAGTEEMITYERGHENDKSYVRQLASIKNTARECGISASGALVMKVGVQGRVVAGPKGGAGTINLPIRIAVAKQTGGSGALYSNLFKVPVQLTAPDFSSAYEKVFDVSVNITSKDRNLIIYVGFDEGKK